MSETTMRGANTRVGSNTKQFSYFDKLYPLTKTFHLSPLVVNSITVTLQYVATTNYRGLKPESYFHCHDNLINVVEYGELGNVNPALLVVLYIANYK